RPWKGASARRRHQHIRICCGCRLALQCPLPRLARAPTGATGRLVHYLGDCLRVSTSNNSPAGHATAVERAGGVGVHHGAARLAGPRRSRPDATTRRRRRRGHFGVAAPRRQSDPRCAYRYSHARTRDRTNLYPGYRFPSIPIPRGDGSASTVVCPRLPSRCVIEEQATAKNSVVRTATWRFRWGLSDYVNGPTPTTEGSLCGKCWDVIDLFAGIRA